MNNKIYILRHEERGNEISFNTPLTTNGLLQSNTSVCEILEKLNIATVYSSPFVRTLQTVKSFCEKHNIPINLEWALVESIPGKVSLAPEFKNIINNNYKSFIPSESSSDSDVIDFHMLKFRVGSFLKSLNLSEGNILLVTHLPVINSILSYKGVAGIDIYTHHDIGTLLSMGNGKVVEIMYK